MWKIFDRADIGAVLEMEAFVHRHSKGHFLQLPSWAQVKRFWKWRGISLYRDGRQVAALSVLIRPLPLGFSLLYAPRGPVGDRNDPALWQELMAAVRHLAKQHRAVLLYMDPDEPYENREFRELLQSYGFTERSDDGFGNIQAQHVFRLRLTGKSMEEIFQTFCPKTRYNIGLAGRKGIKVREYSGAEEIPPAVLESFYRLMVTTGRRDRFYVRDPDYFAGLMKALQNDARLFIAYLEDEPIAGTIEGFCGRKAWYLYGASANEHRNAMPNYLLQWLMIQRAMERDCAFYDFRGVPGDQHPEHPLHGLYRFKKGFSGTYTKFTGLFTYTFRPVLGKLLQLAMRLRQWRCPCVRTQDKTKAA